MILRPPSRWPWRAIVLLAMLCFGVGCAVSAQPLPSEAPAAAPTSQTLAQVAPTLPAPTATAVPPTATPEPAPPTTPTAMPTQTPALLSSGTRAYVDQFYSPAMGRTMPYAVVLPPNYASTDRRYPVLYLLHGLYGGYGEWLDVGIAEITDILLREGDIQPFIIVLPEGDGGAWVNWPNGGPRWSDSLVQDLVPHIDRTYRTLPDRDHRAIGGLSMGGEGALQTALRYPDLFGIAGMHSGSLRLTYADVPVEAYGSEERWRQLQSLWLVENTDAARRLKIWIDVGDQDPYVFAAMALHKALNDRGIPHDYWEPSGVHEAEYWILHQHAYLHWYSDQLYATP
jgi:enterochelin esterase-like enzyme